MTKKYPNELDTVKFSIPIYECKIKQSILPYGKTIGAEYNLYDDKIHFTLSSKLLATPNDIGAITVNNFSQITPIIKKEFGIAINPDYLYKDTLLYRVDVKKDLIMKENQEFYLSDSRRLFKRNTAKYEIHNYENTTYTHGLAIVPKSKANYRFSMYNKDKELCLKRNQEFCKRFTYDYLNNDIKHMLRCELQLRKFSDIKDAFGIPLNKKQTFETVFECPYDVVYTQFKKLLKGVAE